MERLDKIISNQLGYSRREVKDLVRLKRVFVNECLVIKSDMKVDVDKDIIKVDNSVICIKKYIYLMLNKPRGYVSATEDKVDATVLDLVSSEFLHRDLFPAGRLDKDTTGLMVITDDGEFAHNILSPKKHIKKVYDVTIDINITDEMISGFQNGVSLKDFDCKPCLLEVLGKKKARVTLVEGKYHQIKRMFGCFGAKVIELKRICMGNFMLPDDLTEGECREFEQFELEQLKEES